MQYFTYSAMVAMIGSAIFIRMNWMIKASMNLIAFVVYVSVIAGARHCLFDNYDLNVFGICSACEQHVQSKVIAGIILAAMFLATVVLGRSVRMDWMRS